MLMLIITQYMALVRCKANQAGGPDQLARMGRREGDFPHQGAGSAENTSWTLSDGGSTAMQWTGSPAFLRMAKDLSFVAKMCLHLLQIICFKAKKKPLQVKHSTKSKSKTLCQSI